MDMLTETIKHMLFKIENQPLYVYTETQVNISLIINK